MKPLLIGEAPGPNGDAGRPLDGPPGRRLERFMGLDVTPEDLGGAQLREMFDVRNLIERRMERPEGQKGTEWPKEEAAKAARRLLLLMERDQSVVLLGKRVNAAFAAAVGGILPAEFWGVTHIKGGPVFFLIPHPSGIVRTWNDPVNRVRAGMVLWQAMGKISR